MVLGDPDPWSGSAGFTEAVGRVVRVLADVYQVGQRGQGHLVKGW
ncbi:hypothetical protein GCM10010266_44460 [Streptomyces griseomycini]|nr:hypothetical protein GCM10010266_44460 [Streptomyces griseomycini]GGR28290.1 hypothetical protein GCM10015536_37340 [Streptomyces griseomycini]